METWLGQPVNLKISHLQKSKPQKITTADFDNKPQIQEHISQYKDVVLPI